MPLSVTINKNSRDSSAGHSGILKEVNGVNGIPISIAPGFPDLEDQFNQIGITHIRLHDAFGIGDIDNHFEANRYHNQDQLILNIPENLRSQAKKFIADFVNVRTIFPYAAVGMRNNDLNLALKNANYQMTDRYLQKIMNNNPAVNPGNIQRQIMFRIGRTLDGGFELPENFDIYAKLAAELVKRYSLNYQQTGLPRKIAYWEIWNEPDLTFFWNSNDPQKYYQFYDKIARAIKAVDPQAKVGGAGVANGYNPGGAYLDGLLNYCHQNNVPIDFLSWHFYANSTADPQSIIDIGNSIQSTLNQYGFGSIESICTEWNSSPYASINNFTKVQSAKNAAFIASTLIYMQYSKTDKAYYYRGDGSSFGLFNDNPNPTSPNSKSVCTYAAQSFDMFARMFETPFILSKNDNFGTGLSVLAGENNEGNKINILAANFKIDTSFSNPNQPPKETGLYQQYYLDSNRSLSQLTDDTSKNKWFGGIDPTTITTDNNVTQRTIVSQLPVYGRLRARSRNYSQSDSGLNLSINNISSNYHGYRLTAYRIREGGDLSRTLPPDVTSSVNASMNNGTLTLNDKGATPSTVTLYTIELTTDQNGNTGNNGSSGSGGSSGGDNNSGNNGSNGNSGNNGSSGNITPNPPVFGRPDKDGIYSIRIRQPGQYPLNYFFLPNFNFEANQFYFFMMMTDRTPSNPLLQMFDCPNNYLMLPNTNKCENITSKPDYFYRLGSGMFIPYKSGILHNTTLLGRTYCVVTTSNVLTTCTLKAM